MTSLTNSTLWNGLLLTAATVPTLVLTVPGGVIADRFHRRTVLAVTQSWMSLCCVVLAALTYWNLATPRMILFVVLLIGCGVAINLPAWQSMVQDIVPRGEVAAAVSLNSIAFNVGRSLGPAVGGLLVAASGPAVTFLFNAASFLGVVGVLIFYRRENLPRQEKSREGMAKMALDGVRQAMRNPALRAPLLRVIPFVLCGASLWALSPLYARDILDMGAAGYGFLLTTFGLGSILSAAVLPSLRRRIGASGIARMSTILLGLAIGALALHKNRTLSMILFAIAGASWVATLISFNVTIQMKADADVRGRVLSLYIVAFQGSFALGAALWGAVGRILGILPTLLLSGGLLVAGILLDRILPLPGPPISPKPDGPSQTPAA